MVSGKKIRQISENYETPFYLINLSEIEDRFLRLESSFPQDTSIAYAVKANYASSIIQKYNDLGAQFDIFSKGELDLVRKYGCDPERVIYTSVAETEDEFYYALNEGVRTFVLGSRNGIENLDSAFSSSGAEEIDVMLRIQPIKKVDASISTSGSKSKFGTVFTRERDSVRESLGEIDRSGFDFAGFHFHLGTQVRDPEFYTEAIDKTLEFVEEENLDIKMLDIGGGYPVQYSSGVRPVEDYGEEIAAKVEGWRKEIGDFKLIIEPGRFLTAPIVELVTRVVNVKEMYGRKVVIVDGSEDMISLEEHDIGDNLRILTDSDEKLQTTIAGNLCHSEDWLVREPHELPGTNVGDLIVFERMGAYVINRNTAYNLTDIPSVLVLKEDGSIEREKHPFQVARKVLGLD